MEDTHTSRLDALRECILRWYDQGQRSLPWRGTKDPYLVWVSEIMLQQTRAEAVVPYYQAFIAAYEDVFALAQADLDEVLKRWEGLGYYSRARNLHRAARMLADMGGRFPMDAQGLRALPGIGEYTAGMVASIAYGERAPAIDGNQIRVLSRLFLIEQNTREKAGMARIRECAQALLCAERPGDFNQALMDIGRLLCKPKNAACASCPCEPLCLARTAGAVDRLPVLPESKERHIQRRGVALVRCRTRVLVRQRQEALLGGLYEFPHFLDAMDIGALTECLMELGLDVEPIGALPKVHHVFTHLVWQMEGQAFVARRADAPASMRWVDAQELRKLPMPAAMFTYRDEALRMLEGCCP